MLQIANIIGMELIDDGSQSRLKLSSKRLKSGKIQVKFQVSRGPEGVQYGYLLTEPKTSLKDVVGKILKNYVLSRSLGCQRHLYNVGRQQQDTGLLIFK